MPGRDTELDSPLDLSRVRHKGESETDHGFRRISELQDIEWLMSDERGRRFIWRILEMTGLHRSSFTGNSQTFFNEGRRIIGTTLINDIAEAELEELEYKMKIEARQRKQTERKK